MKVLKKILTGMVIILVLIVVGGGLYLSSMGNMNHGTTVSGATQPADQVQKGENTTQPPTSDRGGSEQEAVKEEASGAQDGGPVGQGNSQDNPNAGPPVIVQLQPPIPSVDVSLYVEQLKERLKSINEANSKIASNSAGHSGDTQQNGQTAPSATGNMNELHQGFYKLGQDVAAMEQSLDNLSNGLQQRQPAIGPQVPGNYSYPQNIQPDSYMYPNAPYQPYAGQYNQGQYYPNPSGQNQPDQSGQGVANQQPGQNNQASIDMNSHTASGSKIFNALTAKTVLSLILLVSVVFGVISVLGFIRSLFKDNDSTGNRINQNTI